MGEIIYHDFGGPKKEPEAQKPKDIFDNLDKVTGLAGLLQGNFSEKLDTFTRTMKKLGEMRSYLKTLQAPISHDTIAIRKDMIGNMAFDQICNEVLQSNELDWQKRPVYYMALSEEFTPERLTEILQQGLPSTSDDK